MFLALTLTVLVVSYSGLALEQARKQVEVYSLRYSLERMANDAADVLVKTLGRPSNWENNAEMLETPGLVEESEGNPVQNTIDVRKFGQLRRLVNNDNWVAPANADAVQAIKELFGGSENFEIKCFDENGTKLWHIWPKWDVENSGVENSFEVAVVRRWVVMRYGEMRVDSGMRIRAEAAQWTENLVFEVYQGELDAFDWYIIARGGGKFGVHIFVNRLPNGNYDYNFRQVDQPETIYPNPWPPIGVDHGGIENDPNVITNLHEGMNFLGLKLESKPAGGWSRIYIVMVPSCTHWENAGLALLRLPALLEVKLWR